MRRGMGICSHSHPHSKGYYHIGDRYCCSLEGLAQAHVSLSSRSLFSLSQSGLGTLHSCSLGSFLPNQFYLILGIFFCISPETVPISDCLPCLNHFCIFLSHFCSFWTFISLRPTNSFVSLYLSSFCASFLTHSFRLLLLFHSSRNPIYSHI